MKDGPWGTKWVVTYWVQTFVKWFTEWSPPPPPPHPTHPMFFFFSQNILHFAGSLFILQKGFCCGICTTYIKKMAGCCLIFVFLVSGPSVWLCRLIVNTLCLCHFSLVGSPQAHLHVVGMLRFMYDINQWSLPTPFYSVLVSVSVFTLISTVFHSIGSPDNSPFSHFVFPDLFPPYRSFELYIS